MNKILQSNLKVPNYNYVSPIYNLLARLVYGKKLEEVKKHHLEKLLNCSQIAIIGGGAGSELKYLNTLEFKGCVYFYEPSNLILKAKKLKTNYKVIFINSPWDDKRIYDGVITHFFLDQFSGPDLLNMVQSISKSIKKAGIWVNSDFRNSPRIYHRLLLKFMYLFFRYTTGIPAENLENPDSLIQDNGFTKVKCIISKSQFLHSTLYNKL